MLLPIIFMLVPVAYLGLSPVPVEPQAWRAPAAPGYVGAHATNTGLAGVRHIALQGETGPEHVAIGADGRLYTGVKSGRILRMQPDGGGQEVVAETGGRPLGMAFDAAGRLIVADGIKGLLAVAPDGKVAVLADAVDGAPIRFADGVAVAGDGRIYFTDASTRFGPAQWGGTLEAATLDVIEQSCTGRVLEYAPATGAVRVVAKGLSFANGIVLSGDQRSLLVSESGKYRVWQIAVEASDLDVAALQPPMRAPALVPDQALVPASAPVHAAAQPPAQARIVLDNLPGYPDNLARGLDGRIWLGLAGQRNGLDAMAPYPALRKVMLRIPRALWPTPRPYGHVMAFTEDGAVVADLQDPGGSSPLTTGVTETAGRLYIHNADGKSLDWLAR